MARLVTIASFDRSGPAFVLKLQLEDAGFSPYISNENLVGMDWFGPVKVQVPDTQAEEAVKFIAEFEPPVVASDEPAIHFRCSECGKEISFPAKRRGGVETCPHCYEYVDVPE